MTIKTRRKRLGLTRQDLATAARISTSTLWRIEQGKSAPTRLVSQAIETALALREAPPITTEKENAS